MKSRINSGELRLGKIKGKRINLELMWNDLLIIIAACVLLFFIFTTVWAYCINGLMEQSHEDQNEKLKDIYNLSKIEKAGELLGYIENGELCNNICEEKEKE